MPKIKSIIILIGDVVILYGALAVTLLIRYRQDFSAHFQGHLKPFSLIFLIWLLIFYLADLYQNKSLALNLQTIRNFSAAVLVSAAVSAIFFYLFFSFFELTPKTNLAIFAFVFGVLDLGWRFLAAKISISRGLRNRLLIIGDSPLIAETINYLKTNPQTGYDAVLHIKENLESRSEKAIRQAIASDQVDTVVIQPHLKKDPEVTAVIYKLLPYKITITDFISFYEMIFRKLPLEELEESWFIEKISNRRRLYDILKRFIDIVLSIILGIILLPFALIIAVLVKLTSPGPIFYKEERVGANHKPFTIYKFRSMRVNHNGPFWTVKNDNRRTPIGKIIRFTHLDEIPQLINILKGDISFIGPRPEKKELTELYQELPYYEIRHIIKPGLTGWAQLNYKASASVKEAEEKLRYDIYYIKNRSLILDILILLKTLRYLFTSNG